MPDTEQNLAQHDEHQVIEAIRSNAEGPGRRAFIPDVISDSGLEPEQAQEALRRLEAKNRVELRTDDEPSQFDDADLKICPISDDGWIIVWAIERLN